MGSTHRGDPANPPCPGQERYSKATGPSPARLHRGPLNRYPEPMAHDLEACEPSHRLSAISLLSNPRNLEFKL